MVSNCDAVRTYRELSSDTPQSAKFDKQERIRTGLQRRRVVPWARIGDTNNCCTTILSSPRDPEEEFD